jgi:hypothetical protein
MKRKKTMSMKNRSMRKTTSHKTMTNNKTTISSKTGPIKSTPQQQDRGEEGEKNTW